jgi:hypothetical protein
MDIPSEEDKCAKKYAQELFSDGRLSSISGLKAALQKYYSMF